MDLTNLKLCDVCAGFVAPVPENYDGPAVHPCYCSEERHIQEQLLKAGQPDPPDALIVRVGEFVHTKDKMV